MGAAGVVAYPILQGFTSGSETNHGSLATPHYVGAVKPSTTYYCEVEVYHSARSYVRTEQRSGGDYTRELGSHFGRQRSAGPDGRIHGF